MSTSAGSVALTRAHFVAELRRRGFRRPTTADLEAHDESIVAHLRGDDLRENLKGRLSKKIRKLIATIGEGRRDALESTLAESNDLWFGDVSSGEGTDAVLIELNGNFPFVQPSVRPRLDFPMSWHRNGDGTMCLYPPDERSGLPWLNPDDLLGLVSRWLYESKAGWSGDLPMLDIEAYVPISKTEFRMVVYGDLDGLEWVRFRADRRVIRLVGAGRCPEGPRFEDSGVFSDAYGYVADIGSPEVPPRTWDDIVSLLGDQATEVSQAISRKEIRVLLLRYARGGIAAVLALAVAPAEDGTGVTVASLSAASENVRDLVLRAGFDAPHLASKNVLVVGMGAVGSFIADSLARAGVGSLRVMDFQRVTPGNLVRHLATDGHVGLPKVLAVRDVIEDRRFNRTRVEPIVGGIFSIDQAAEAVRAHDLIIDATADGTVTALLHHAALTEGAHVLSACLKENGQIARVDVLPPLDEGSPIPTPVASLPSEVPVAYESGCYSAVSLTPHAAVIEAASLATRFAIAMLMGRSIDPAGAERDYR